MRRRLRMLLFAALLVAVAVPFGTALTLDRRATPVRAAAVQPAATTVTLQFARQLPQSAALMLTGWLLIGLAAAVRRIA